MDLTWMAPSTRRVVRCLLALGYLSIGQALGDRYPYYTGALPDELWRYGFSAAAAFLVVQLVVPRWSWSLWLYEVGGAIVMTLATLRIIVLTLIVVPLHGAGAMVELGLWANLAVFQWSSFVAAWREVRT